jgi:hypothetical protein
MSGGKFTAVPVISVFSEISVFSTLSTRGRMPRRNACLPCRVTVYKHLHGKDRETVWTDWPLATEGREHLLGHLVDCARERSARGQERLHHASRQSGDPLTACIAKLRNAEQQGLQAYDTMLQKARHPELRQALEKDRAETEQ